MMGVPFVDVRTVLNQQLDEVNRSPNAHLADGDMQGSPAIFPGQIGVCTANQQRTNTLQLMLDDGLEQFG